MQKYPFTRTLAATWCLLLLGLLLLLSACNNSSSPNSHPTPGGYTIFIPFDQEMQLVLAPPRR